jgi:hypothetical protein
VRILVTAATGFVGKHVAGSRSAKATTSLSWSVRRVTLGFVDPGRRPIRSRAGPDETLREVSHAKQKVPIQR